MRVSDLINLSSRDWNAMSDSELRKNALVLQSAANKRIKRLNESGIYSPALESLHASGWYHFSIANKNRNEVMEQVRAMGEFMTKKTSTVKGAREVFNRRQKNYEKQFGHKYDKDMDSKLSPLIEELRRLTGNRYKPSEYIKASEQAIQEKPKSSFQEVLDYAYYLLTGIRVDNETEVEDIISEEEYTPRKFT